MKSIIKHTNINIKTATPGTFYFGIDPTGHHLHLGHLIVIKLAIMLMNNRWKCIVVIGGFTGSIGDPTDKSSTRTRISYEDILLRQNTIIHELKTILSPYDVTFVNNIDWLREIKIDTFMKFLSHVTLSPKLSNHTVAQRLNNNKPVTMQEFLYPELQAYDFMHLYSKYNVTLQIGGGDQWGNISQGLHIMNRINNTDNFYGAVTHLLTHKGKKMGKTTGNSVNLFSDINDFIGYIHTFPQDTLEQLASMFETKIDVRDVTVAILSIIYHQNDVNIYVDKYYEKLNAHEPYRDFRIVKCNEKLSNVVASVFDISKSEAKKLISDGHVTVNNMKTVDNITLVSKIHKVTIYKYFIYFIKI